MQYKKLYEMNLQIQKKIDILEKKDSFPSDQYQFYKASTNDVNDISVYVFHYHYLMRKQLGPDSEIILGNLYDDGLYHEDANIRFEHVISDVKNMMEKDIIFCLKEKDHLVGCMRIKRKWDEIWVYNLYCQSREIAVFMTYELIKWMNSQKVYVICPNDDLVMYDIYKDIGFQPKKNVYYAMFSKEYYIFDDEREHQYAKKGILMMFHND